LGALLSGVDHEFALSGNPGSEGFPQARTFGPGKTGEVVKADAQADLGIELIDVLASRPPGSREIGPGRSVDGIVKENGVHIPLYRCYLPIDAFSGMIALRYFRRDSTRDCSSDSMALSTSSAMGKTYRTVSSV
jgi:hypothetical protein